MLKNEDQAMVDIRNTEGLPSNAILEQVLCLNRDTFGNTRSDITEFASTKPDVLLTVAMSGNRVVGYKIGYQDTKGRFYSWLGAVAADARGKGIGSRLMESQHAWCRERGYKTVRTKTKNKWKNMLILNLKHGFDIIGTYTDDKGEPKIILEKRLK